MATRAVAPLIVITGPTASGKTSLAVRLARRCGGEIICADSRTIYTGMDIGTAKPTQEEQDGVPHWGLDLVEPGEVSSAAQFKTYAQQKIAEIRRRGNVPFLVGGTGLYIDSVVYNFSFGSAADSSRRQSLMSQSLYELHEYCHKNNIPLPENKYNHRYVVRAIERHDDKITTDNSPLENTIVVGIATDAAQLRERIERRAEQLFSHGVVEEATMLGKKYGWDSEAMTGNIYRLTHQFICGNFDYIELQRRFATSDWQLAKRQLTWMRRNPDILWCDLVSAEHYLSQVLADCGSS